MMADPTGHRRLFDIEPSPGLAPDVIGLVSRGS
jgi:hypothetical protein